jgi:ABC-2 type transport system permease protein
MRTFAALARRELGVYFVSPSAYVILTVLLLLGGSAFTNSMAEFSKARVPADFRYTLMFLMGVVCLSTALVTMRLVAEEKSRGTLEIMLTAPVSEVQFVLAKYAAALVLLAYLLLPTTAYAFIVGLYSPVDAGAVACGYFGLLLVGAVTYSIGLFISSLCTSQVTAGLITFLLAAFLLLAGTLAQFLPLESGVRPALEAVDLSRHFADFLKGVVDRSRLSILLSLAAFFLFLTVRVLQSRRWR